MHFPLPMTILVAAGTPAPDTVPVTIFLNRTGINSIETPKDPVTARIGTMLPISFVNRGAPIHITISSPNASMYTAFFHENLYVVDETLLEIPIRNDCHEGFFDIEILAGYGGMKAGFRVTVRHAEKMVSKETAAEQPLHPVAHGRPHLLMITLGIALVLYTTWLYTRIEVLNLVSFIVLVVGALYTWYRQA